MTRTPTDAPFLAFLPLCAPADPPVTVTALDASQLAVPLPTSAGAPGLGELSSGQVPHNDESGSQQVVERAQKMVGLLMERGYVLGVDAVQRAKDLDERAGAHLTCAHVLFTQTATQHPVRWSQIAPRRLSRFAHLCRGATRGVRLPTQKQRVPRTSFILLCARSFT